jgi:hypothetical protein
MSIDYSTDALVASVKLKASLPNSQSLFTPANLVDFLDTEMRSLVIPQIMDTREEFLEVSADFTSTTGIIDIPSNAIGLKLKLVEYVFDDDAVYPLERIEYKQRGSLANTNQPGQPRWFYLKGNKVYIYPYPVANTSYTIRLTYFRRPNILTVTSNCGQIQSIDTGTNTVTLVSAPSSWVTGTELDIIAGTPGFDALYEDVSIVSIAGFDVTLASVANLSVGDWLAPTGYSPIPQVVFEAHNLIAQAAAAKAMESLADSKGLEAAQAKLQELQRAFITMITPRVESSVKKIVQWGGPMRTGYGPGGGWGIR